jgi:hypothetical protein
MFDLVSVAFIRVSAAFLKPDKSRFGLEIWRQAIDRFVSGVPAYINQDSPIEFSRHNAG